MMKKILASVLISMFLVGGSLNAQDKRFRGELKLGVPNLVGVSTEYLLPDLGVEPISNSLAPYIDFSSFSLPLDETVTLGYGYFALGAKYYADKYVDDLGLPSAMKGVYAGLGFSRMTLSLTDDEWYSFEYGDGTAEGSTGVSMFEIKLGKRWFFGPLTLAVETGTTLGKMDDKIKVEVEYPGGVTETDYEDTSDIPLGSGTIGAITIGIAF